MAVHRCASATDSAVAWRPFCTSPETWRCHWLHVLCFGYIHPLPQWNLSLTMESSSRIPTGHKCMTMSFFTLCMLNAMHIWFCSLQLVYCISSQSCRLQLLHLCFFSVDSCMLNTSQLQQCHTLNGLLFFICVVFYILQFVFEENNCSTTATAVITDCGGLVSDICQSWYDLGLKLV